MGKRDKWTIAIRPNPDAPARKITKIAGLNGAGFSVIAPYHSARSGSLAKLPHPGHPISGTRQIRQEDLIGFTADDRAKLSYHTDGFAQFSSESQGRIISGRDPETGEPKGLGLITRPLSDPISSGPSMGIQAWGLDEFEEANEEDAALTFEPNHFYYRDCRPHDACHWLLSIFVFSARGVPPVQYRDGHITLDAGLECLGGPRISVVRLSVIPLPTENILLGLQVNAMNRHPPPPSGWILNGPGDYALGKDGYVLMGFYPRPAMHEGAFASIDRPASNPML